jgi:hypothetical protein
MKRWLPRLVTSIFVVYVGSAILRPAPSTGGFDLDGFGRLPISLNGRVQPIDSAARLALLQLRGTVTVTEGPPRGWQVWKAADGLNAIEWLLEALTRPDAADTRKIFRIPDAAVRATAIEVQAAGTPPIYYSYKDLQPRVKEVHDQVARAGQVKPADRTPTDRAWLKLRDDLVVYERLKNSLQPNSFLQEQAAGQSVGFDFGARLASYDADMRAAIAARRDGKKDGLDKATEERIVAFVRPFVGLSRAALLSLLPPVDPERGRDRWLNTGAALVGSSRTGVFPASLTFFARMGAAYAQGNADDFNIQLSTYQKWLTGRGWTPEVSRARTESFYSHFQPLVRALAVYLVVLSLVIASMIGRSTTLYRTAAMLLGLAGALHMTGILFDMMLQGTLPVTNLYSAIVSGGIIAVFISAALERKYRNGLGLVAASLAGLWTVVGAHGLAPGGIAALAAEAIDAGLLLAACVAALTLWFGLRPLQPFARASDLSDVATRVFPT